MKKLNTSTLSLRATCIKRTCTPPPPSPSKKNKLNKRFIISIISRYFWCLQIQNVIFLLVEYYSRSTSDRGFNQITWSVSQCVINLLLKFFENSLVAQNHGQCPKCYLINKNIQNYQKKNQTTQLININSKSYTHTQSQLYVHAFLQS